MFELRISYYLLDPFRSQGRQSKCAAHLKARQEKEVTEECSNFPPASQKRFMLEVGLAANPCAPGEPEPKKTCKEPGKAGFPQTTRFMQYQIPAALYRGTMEISP